MTFLISPALGDIGIKFNLQNKYRVSLFQQSENRGLFLASTGRTLLGNNFLNFEKRAEIDSTGRFVIISEKPLNAGLKLPTVITLDHYLSFRRIANNRNLWRETAFKNLRKTEEKKGRRGGIDIDIPIPIKSKAFERIFGSSSVGLEVVGNVSIDGGLRHEKRSQVKTAFNRGSDYDFKMKQTQRFTVTGKVGEKVSVSVDQDSERPFEFNNTVRLKYTGDEDEIVQNIEAGNISLSLPATRFVTFSGKNTGLFGIKSEMKMGRFNLTAIASQEKGQRQKLTLTGGAQEGVLKIEDYQYKRGTYYFLNNFYREQFFKKLRPDGTHEYDSRRVINHLEVYKSEARYEREVGAIRGWAIADTGNTGKANPAHPDTLVQPDQEHYRGYFLRLDPSEYFVERDLGFIAMNSPLREGEVLAVAYRDTMGNGPGHIEFDETKSSTIILQLLKPRNPRPSDSTWKLEWKNVYSLGAKNISKEGFDLKIYYKPPSGDPQDSQAIDGQTKSYLEIFGLDQKDQYGNPTPDNILDDDPNIINWARGELIFPDPRPFDPEGLSELAPDKRTPAIYDTINVPSYIATQSKFYIEVKSKNKSANYSLGFNVIEGSEEVFLGGRRLTRGVDYIIDYYSGNLTLLSEEATRPTANVEINYELNQFFQIDRKTLLGARGQYNFSDNSYIGGTFLYLNQSTLDQKIRVDREGPMRNMVWDINTALNFRPNFLTRAINALPFIETDEQSSIAFEAEVARVIPNPNTRNNEPTGDKDGVAYIDDFEGIKRITPLGIGRRQWTQASAPYQYYPDVSMMGRLIWYNPWDQVAIKEIWPERDVNPNVPQRVHVLTLEFEPNPDYGEQSWGGIMRALSPGYADQSNSKFLEIWVQGDTGTIHIDFGQISEDVIPNGRLDTEDRSRYGIRNGILDDDEDVGLDDMIGPDPSLYPYPHDPNARKENGRGVPYDFWDINGDGIKQEEEPWSYDNWSYHPGGGYSQTNGTEGNANDEGVRYPDTEDINGNGDVDLANSYFEFSFSLDTASVYIAGGSKKPGGWRLYRIPLDMATIEGKGTPQWSLIEYIRIWVDGFRSRGRVRIAEINLVGNEWKEAGVAPAEDPDQYDAQNDSTITVTVVNTHDNPDYKPPPGVSGERDRITQVIAKEQSLVLKVENLDAGENGIVKKDLYQPQNYMNYNKMKMYVYGKDYLGYHITEDSSQIEFFLRFGSDKNNYYEFRQRVYPGWDPRNEMEIDLLELTSIKFDTSKTLIKKGKQYRIVGKPSLTNVRQFIAGVKNLSKDTPFSGEIWLNELRLSGVKKDTGWAMRARTDIKIANLGNVSAEINRQDADFHNINTRFGSGDNRLSSSISARLSLDKFLPASWGISLPLAINHSQSQATPKYFPGSDIEVNQRTAPDSLLDQIRSINSRSGLNLSFRKKRKSKNPLIRYTLDNITANFSKTTNHLSNSLTRFSDNWSYDFDVNYNLTFGKPFFKPFGWLAGVPILKRLSRSKFYYTPSKLNLKLSSTERGRTSETRSGIFTRSHSFDLTRSINTGIQPFESLSLDFSRTHISDMRRIEKEEIFKGNFGELVAITQQFSTKYNPNIVTWLKTNFSYNANFRYNNNLQQRRIGKSASSDNTLSASLTFSPNLLIKAIHKPKRKRSSPRPRPPKAKEEGKEKQKDETRFSLWDGLNLIGEKLGAITVRYTQRNNVRAFGLDTIPSFGFQIGTTRDPGVTISQNVGSNRGSYGQTNNLSIQTGVNFTRNLNTTFKYDFNQRRTQTTNITGTTSESYLNVGKNKIPFFEWTLRWTGWEKFPLFENLASRVSLEHAYSGKKSETWDRDPENITKEDITSNFGPLIGLNIQWKNGMNTTVRYNKSNSLSTSKRYGTGGSRRSSSNLSITTNYSKSGGLKIPLPFWPFKNKVIKNQIDLSITFNKSKDVTEQSRGERGGFVETTKTEKWSFTPRLTYSFSSQVRGGVKLELGKIKNKLTGETSIQEFGVNVNISITGG